MKLLPGGKKLERYQHIYIYLHATTLSYPLTPFLLPKVTTICFILLNWKIFDLQYC